MAPAFLLLALLGAAPQPVPASPAGAEPTAAAFDVRYDDLVVERFLEFVARGDAAPDELAAWVRLPGNFELLRQGRNEGGLTPDILAEAARVTIRGGKFPGPDVLGSLRGGEWPVLRGVLDGIRERETGISIAAAQAIRPYLPAGVTLPPFAVRFHLGGSWDGRTTDAVYINLTLFQARGLASLPGIDALLVHELFHFAHGALFPGVDDWSSRQSALYTVLLRMQQEGMARQIESGWLRRRARPVGLDEDHLAKYEDGLARAPQHAALLAEIVARVEAGDCEGARLLAQRGFRSGGPLYAVGHAMAAAIEGRGGPGALAATITGGPLAFGRAYEATLPAGVAGATSAAGGASLLPAGLPSLLRALESGYGRDPVLATRLRRQGLALLVRGDRDAAVEALRQAVDLDPTDATSAYNLACAEALLGRQRRAMKWLREAFARGFDEVKHVALDEDLVTLRGRNDFKKLLQSQVPLRRAPGRDQPAAPKAAPPDEPDPAPTGGPGGGSASIAAPPPAALRLRVR